MTELSAYVDSLIAIHTSEGGKGSSTITEMALRIRELEERVAELTDQRDIARSAVNLLRAAVQEHHDTHYLPITHSANRPVVAVHDAKLYNLAGIHHMKPEPFDLNPQWHRLAGMRAHWESKQAQHLPAIVG